MAEDSPNQSPTPRPGIAASHRVRWQTTGDYDHVLTGRSAPDWLALADHPDAQIVKQNPLRQVFHVEHGSQCYFAKVFNHQRGLARIKRRLLGPPALAEYLLGQELARIGVGTVRMIAAGVSDSTGRSVLISEEFSAAHPLAEVWAQHAPARRGLIDVVARFVARTHGANVLPRDMHAGNLLVRPSADANGWEIAFVDLAGMRLNRPVSNPEAARNLAELYQWFRSRSRATEQARFLRAYTAARFGSARVRRRRFAVLVTTASEAHQRKLWAKRDRRILNRNSYFTRLDLSGGWTAQVVLRHRGAHAELDPFAGERSVTTWLAWLGEHLPDPGTRCLTDLPNDLYLQCERAGRRGGLWWRLFGSDQRKRFVLAQALRHRDIPAVHVPAFFERHAWGSDARTALLIHQPTEWETLRGALRRLLTEPGERTEYRRHKRHYVVMLAHLLADMVTRGLCARKLTLDTFAVIPTANSPHGLVCVTEFADLAILRRTSRATALWMATQLSESCPRTVTQADRLRFLRTYWARLPRRLRPGGWEDMWRRIAESAGE